MKSEDIKDEEEEELVEPDNEDITLRN